MKINNKIKLKNIENKFMFESAKSLCFSYKIFQDLLIINTLNVKINERFKWSGRLLCIPDNGRRKVDKKDFVLTKEYLEFQPIIADILQGFAIEQGKKLALNFKSD